MCWLRWSGWLCRLCVPLSLGVLRRRSLLSLRGYVGVWRLRSRVGARGLRTGVRALCGSLYLGCGSLALSGRGGLCLE